MDQGKDFAGVQNQILKQYAQDSARQNNKTR